VARANAVPRPAKPARQMQDARQWLAKPMHSEPNLRENGERWLPRGDDMRAYLPCRTGCAGRGTAFVRATERDTLALHPRPKTQSWVGI